MAFWGVIYSMSPQHIFGLHYFLSQWLIFLLLIKSWWMYLSIFMVFYFYFFIVQIWTYPNSHLLHFKYLYHFNQYFLNIPLQNLLHSTNVSLYSYRIFALVFGNNFFLLITSISILIEKYYFIIYWQITCKNYFQVEFFK